MSSKTRLAALGYGSYRAYLASDRWAAFKASYRASDRPQRCAVCQAGRVHLHHVTYARLGAELLTDVMPLCETHHNDVHAALKARRLTVERTADVLPAHARAVTSGSPLYGSELHALIEQVAGMIALLPEKARRGMEERLRQAIRPKRKHKIRILRRLLADAQASSMNQPSQAAPTKRQLKRRRKQANRKAAAMQKDRDLLASARADAAAWQRSLKKA